MDMDMDMGMSMHMTLYWGRDVTILFDSWQTSSWLSYLLSLLALFVFSILYQFMEDQRLRFKLLTINSKPATNGYTPLLYSKLTGGGSRRTAAKLVGAFLFAINSGMGYLLMLSIMSFNGGVLLAAVVGLGFGYLLFRSGDDEAAVVVLDNPCACS